MRRGVLLSCCLVAACVRAGYDSDADARVDLATTDGGALDRARDVADLGRVDVAGDALADEGIDEDGATDRAPPPDLGPPGMICAAPALVGTGQPSNLITFAARASGLQLVAKAGNAIHVANRPASDQPFGAWTRDNKLLSNNDVGDFSFVDVQGTETYFWSNNGSVRSLSACTAPFDSCAHQPLDLQLLGQPITLDVDGPSVVTLPNGDLLMAHNIGPGGNETGDIYLSTLSTPNLATLGAGWQTSAVSGLGSAVVKEDDPALSSDGLVLIFAANYGTLEDFDLYVVTRGALTDAFSAPRAVEGVNTAFGEGQAELVGASELYFVSVRTGTPQLYRAACTLAGK